jgi:Flp pilus assembly protein TadG
MLSFSIVCIFIYFIIIFSTYQTHENISDMAATASAHTGEVSAKAKNSLPIFGGKCTLV